MIIKRIQVEDFGSIGRFEFSFDPRLAVLPAPHAEAVMKAVGIVLKSRALAGQLPTVSGAAIRAEIEAGKRVFFISASEAQEAKGFHYDVRFPGKPCADFYDTIRQRPEEEDLSRFVFDRRDRYSHRFMRYRNAEQYYSKRQFSELTDGVGDTRLFRACLHSHIEQYAPDPAFPSPAPPDADSEMLHEYLCFISLNRFWKRIEAIRDLNHVEWPLFLCNSPFPGRNASERSACLEEALSLGRQVFICDPETRRGSGRKSVFPIGNSHVHVPNTVHHLCYDDTVKRSNEYLNGGTQ